MSIKKIIECFYLQARDTKEVFNEGATEDDFYYNLVDKTDLYKFQFIMAVLMSTNLYYQNYFVNFFFSDSSRVSIIIGYLKLLLNIDNMLTKQLNIAILGMILILNNYDLLNKLDKKEIEDLIMLTFRLLIKQKREESDKLKFELDNELDCQFLLEDEHDEDTDE